MLRSRLSVQAALKALEKEEQVSREASSRELRMNYTILKMDPNPTVGRLKYLCTPDLTRSRAIPLRDAAWVRSGEARSTGGGRTGAEGAHDLV